MDMKISGSGVVSSGEYDDIIISGSSKVNGDIRCKNMKVAGAISCMGNIECLEQIYVSGSASFKESISANHLKISGSVIVEKDCVVKKDFYTSGSIKSYGNIKAQELKSSGMIIVDGGVESEIIEISGAFHCKGLVNAENIKITFQKELCVNEIGGSSITILPEEKFKLKKIHFPLFSKTYNESKNSVNKVNVIEGDTISVEGIEVEKIVGRIVSIGKNCKIGLVQYSENLEIDEDAKVKKYEKIL
jgi:hypothetical protein